MMHTAVFYATHSFFRRMKTIEIFFSPTGGTRKVCDALTRAIDNGEPTVIDMAKPEWTNSVQHIVPTDCLAVIAAPSFAGRVPSTMAARMAQVRAEGGKAVIVCVYGNRAYDDTLVELQDLAEQSGFTVVAAVAAIAEHSVVRQYATGRPDSDDMAMLTDFANKIKFKLSSGKYSVPQIPGNRPYREVKPSGVVPMPSEGCTQCGLCAQQCPVQAISHNDVSQTDPSRCIMCMRCVAICPAKARHIPQQVEQMLTAHLKPLCATRKHPELYL